MQAYDGGATKRRKYLKKERKLKVRGNVKKKKDFVLSIAPSGKKKKSFVSVFFLILNSLLSMCLHRISIQKKKKMIKRQR